MITILSGTNRPESNTLKVAKHYAELLAKQGVDNKLFSLEKLPLDIAFSEVVKRYSEKFQLIVDEFIVPTDKFVIISPEYNGSFPGILKVFLDAVHPDLNRHKKVALVGVSNGRAGNLRGMDHLTGVLNYLGMHVHPNKLPISSVLTLLDRDGNIKDPFTLKVLEKHAMDIVKW